LSTTSPRYAEESQIAAGVMIDIVGRHSVTFVTGWALLAPQSWPRVGARVSRAGVFFSCELRARVFGSQLGDPNFDHGGRVPALSYGDQTLHMLVLCFSFLIASGSWSMMPSSIGEKFHALTGMGNER